MPILAAALILSWAHVNPAAQDTEPATLVVDLIDGHGPSFQALQKRYGLEKPVPKDAAELPKRLRDTPAWWVVSPSGTQRYDVADYLAIAGAGEDHLLARLAKAPAKNSAEGLALSQAPAKGAKLLKPAPAKLPRIARQAILKHTLAALTKAVRKATRYKKPGRKDLRVIAVDRPGDTPILLAFLAIPQRSAPERFLSALARVNSKGRILEWLNRPAVDLYRSEPLWTVRLDATKPAAIIIEDSYYEGAYTLLLRLTADGPKVTRLTGDGA